MAGGAQTADDADSTDLHGFQDIYFLINARNLDEAIVIGGQIPGARIGTVEIRPVMEIAGLPEK